MRLSRSWKTAAVTVHSVLKFHIAVTRVRKVAERTKRRRPRQAGPLRGHRSFIATETGALNFFGVHGKYTAPADWMRRRSAFLSTLRQRSFLCTYLTRSLSSKKYDWSRATPLPSPSSPRRSDWVHSGTPGVANVAQASTHTRARAQSARGRVDVKHL